MEKETNALKEKITMLFYALNFRIDNNQLDNNDRVALSIFLKHPVEEGENVAFPQDREFSIQELERLSLRLERLVIEIKNRHNPKD